MLIKEGNCVVVNSIHYLYLYMDNANQPLQTDDLGLIEGVVRQENGASDGFVRRYGDLIYSTCSSIFDEDDVEKRTRPWDPGRFYTH